MKSITADPWLRALGECMMDKRWVCLFNHPLLTGRYEMFVPLDHPLALLGRQYGIDLTALPDPALAVRRPRLALPLPRPGSHPHRPR